MCRAEAGDIRGREGGSGAGPPPNWTVLPFHGRREAQAGNDNVSTATSRQKEVP